MASTRQLDVPRTGTDASGRAVPMTDDEARARGMAIAHALDALDDMGDEREQRQSFEALAQGVDADRLSDRPRFRPQ